MRIEVEFNDRLKSGNEQAAQIQSALDRVGTAGGGTVAIGPGVYSCTTIFLRSNVDLLLERGCVIQAHHDLNDYPEVSPVAANKDQSFHHLVVAQHCKNIKIYGEGVIDGQDQAFYTPCTNPADRPYGIFRYTVKGGNTRRPSPLVQIVSCKNVKMKDITLRAAPGWTLHFFDCDQVWVDGITILGDPFGPNTDGIGINGSRDARISNCHVDTGDDAIIIKATNVESVCERVTVSNCVLASNCAALGLGADVYGAIRDVVFSNCVVKKSLRMIQVEMWFSGQIERVIFSDITGRTFPDDEVLNERPIYIDIQEFKRPKGELGKVSDLQFRNIICESRGRIVMTAQDGSQVDGVLLDGVTVIVPEIEDPEVSVPASNSMQLSNFNPVTRALRSAIVADNIHRLTLKNVEFRWPQHSAVPMSGITYRNCTEVLEDCPRLTANDPTVPRVVEV